MFNGRSFWTCILFPGLRLLRWRTPVEGMNAKQDYLQSAPTELTAIWQQHSQTEHANHSFAQCICGEQRGQRKRWKKLYHEVIHLLNIPNKKQEKIIFRQFLNYFGFDYDLYILFDHIDYFFTLQVHFFLLSFCFKSICRNVKNVPPCAHIWRKIQQKQQPSVVSRSHRNSEALQGTNLWTLAKFPSHACCN